MASQPEKIATLEEKVKSLEGKKPVDWTIFVAVVVVATSWLTYTTVTFNKLSERVAHLEGKIGDPLSATISNLKFPNSTEALSANLKMLAAQIDVNRASKNKPKQENIQKVVDALSSIAARDPQLPETWQAVASLASYRTSAIYRQIAPLPDCDVSRPKNIMYADELRNIPQLFGRPGYLFRNCTLHMGRLPPGHVIRGKAVLPGQVDPQPYTLGAIAVIIDCDIVLTDEGVADSDIAFFYSFSSRLEYRIEKTPKPIVQTLLIASIQSAKPGDFSFKVT